MLHLLRERGVEVPRLEATIFALGIHEDTGSLTYPRTTIRDAEMLAASMRLGASQPLIERYLHSALTGDQREVLMRDGRRWCVSNECAASTYTLWPCEVPGYVDGLSVIAHKLMELINAEVLLQAVGMEDRVFVTARSRAGSVDVGALLQSVGGGGHAQAASAVVRGQTPRATHRRAAGALSQSNLGAPTAGEIMSRPVRFIDADTPVTDALVTAQRYGHSGICVREDGRVVGIVARRDLDKAFVTGSGTPRSKGS